MAMLNNQMVFSKRMSTKFSNGAASHQISQFRATGRGRLGPAGNGGAEETPGATAAAAGRPRRTGTADWSRLEHVELR